MWYILNIALRFYKAKYLIKLGSNDNLQWQKKIRGSRIRFTGAEKVFVKNNLHNTTLFYG